MIASLRGDIAILDLKTSVKAFEYTENIVLKFQNDKQEFIVVLDVKEAESLGEQILAASKAAGHRSEYGRRH